MTVGCLIAFCVGFWLRSRRRDDHHPRLLALEGERHTTGVTWQCVATGTQSAELCRCVGCWDRITRCFPDAYTWQDAELAWFRHANKAR